jgi:hypothetical protein
LKIPQRQDEEGQEGGGGSGLEILEGEQVKVQEKPVERVLEVHQTQREGGV